VGVVIGVGVVTGVVVSVVTGAGVVGVVIGTIGSATFKLERPPDTLLTHSTGVFGVVVCCSSAPAHNHFLYSFIAHRFSFGHPVGA